MIFSFKDKEGGMIAAEDMATLAQAVKPLGKDRPIGLVINETPEKELKSGGSLAGDGQKEFKANLDKLLQSQGVSIKPVLHFVPEVKSNKQSEGEQQKLKKFA